MLALSINRSKMDYLVCLINSSSNRFWICSISEQMSDQFWIWIVRSWLINNRCDLWSIIWAIWTIMINNSLAHIKHCALPRLCPPGGSVVLSSCPSDLYGRAQTAWKWFYTSHYNVTNLWIFDRVSRRFVRSLLVLVLQPLIMLLSDGRLQLDPL